jgi:AraC-like DNA-binding protein
MEPYSLVFEGDYQMPVLALDLPTMRRLTPDPDRFLGIRMAREDCDCGLLSSFVAQVTARMSSLEGPMLRRVEDNILNLLGGILNARTGRSVSSSQHQLCLIKAYIAAHLHDRRLSPTTIATALGFSTRYVHALFEAEPASVGEYIRNCRLSACRDMLLDQNMKSTSLTMIALECGFYDLSHMSRCFRARYGAAPQSFRVAASYQR